MVQKMNDQQLTWDCLKDQKFMAGNYTTMATEIANTGLLQDTVKICNEEIKANYDIFNLMNQRGWYKVENADQQLIWQAQTKAQQLKQTL